MSPCAARWIGAALVVIAAGCGSTTPPPPPDVTASGGAGGSSTSVSSTSAGVGGAGNAPYCPPELPDQRDEDIGFTDICYSELDERCYYPNGCSDDGCELRCVGNLWLPICEPCDGVLPDCPAEAPPHGSSCAVATSDYQPCLYDDCSGGNGFAIARCELGNWKVEHTLCVGAGCYQESYEGHQPEDAAWCPAFTVCMDAPACTYDHALNCHPNPCFHEPFSCACAGYLCGDELECVEAQGGWVTCVAPAGPPDPTEVIVSGKQSTAGLALGGGYLYWSSSDGHPTPWETQRIPVGLGPIESLAIAPTTRMASDDDCLFALYVDTGMLLRMSHASMSVDTLATGYQNAVSLRLGQDDVFFATSGPTELWQVPKIGGAVTVALAQSLSSYAVDATHIYHVVREPDPNGGYLSTLGRTPLGGGASETLLPTLSGLMGLTLDEDTVYLSHRPSSESPSDPQGKVLAVTKGGGPATVLATGQYFLSSNAFLARSDFVYWSTGNGIYGKVKRVPKTGGPVEVIASAQGNPAWLVADDTHVSWANDVPAPCGAIKRRHHAP